MLVSLNAVIPLKIETQLKEYSKQTVVTFFLFVLLNIVENRIFHERDAVLC